MKKFEYKVSFRDANNNRANIEIKCEWEHISFTWECNGHYWQCDRVIIPATKTQIKLLTLWNRYHLNGMSSGTEKQNLLIEEWKAQWNKYDYDVVKDYLKTINIHWDFLTVDKYQRFLNALEQYQKELAAYNTLYKAIASQEKETIVSFVTDDLLVQKYFDMFLSYLGDSVKVKDVKLVQPLNTTRSPSHEKLKQALDSIQVPYENDLFLSAYVDMYKWIPFIYGHAWTHVDVPSDIEEQIIQILEEIQKEQDDSPLLRNLSEVVALESISTLADNNEVDIEKVFALWIHLDARVADIEFYTKWYWDNIISAEGSDYIVCTDEEANEEHLEYIENLVDEIWFEAFGKSKINVSRDDDGDIIVSREVCIPSNERWNSLNSYDWNEYEVKVWDTTYYIYQK